MEYTGSSYKGKCDYHKRMDGKGIYTFPTGSRYKGDFKDGEFHGKGTIYLPNDTEFKGQWARGNHTQGSIIFADDLSWSPIEWQYCTAQDRRFYSEIVNGLKPAGRSQLTDKEPTPEIPLNCYDTGDGFYDPSTGVVTSYAGKFLRHANEDEHSWIVSKCRRGSDEIVGKKP